ncbi:MAG: alanine--tRNA ligase, partial [Mycoplasma sp.]|nr:alanine--tRNA ligase [Mycoplasma sp.]
MGYLTSKQIRQIFIDFFKNRHHFILESKPLLPIDDDSLLLINSGIATLKKYFTHQKIPPSTDLANSQKCVRTNDIENVGLTNRHLTFFEMLGNFSIGGYFKKKAIDLAYEFIFELLKLPKKLIYITYHKDDKLTYDLWKEKDIDPSHLIAGDNSTNFWDLGHGPCGPNTEIFYDLGEKYDPNQIGLKLLKDNIENDRYLEIWNIVFSEFNNDGANNYQELPKKNIDTGIGFERLVSVLQKKDSIFETDLFYPMIQFLEQITNLKYQDKKREFRVIVDHFRSITLLISDGLLPSNQKAGYILRKLIR